MPFFAISPGRDGGGARLWEEFVMLLAWRAPSPQLVAESVAGPVGGEAQPALDQPVQSPRQFRKRKERRTPANRRVDPVAFFGGEIIAVVVFWTDIFEGVQQFFVGQVARAWSSMSPLCEKGCSRPGGW